MLYTAIQERTTVIMQMIKVFLKKPLLFVILPLCSILLLFGIYIYFILVHIGDHNRTINGIDVPGMLCFNSWRDYEINYSKLLEKATMNDAKSIKRLILLDFDGAYGYDHGGVIVDLIGIIGEDKFIQSIATINIKQKKIVESYIKVGLEYGGNHNFQNKTFEEAFPKIYAFTNPVATENPIR
jgi:hypothetical protein